MEKNATPLFICLDGIIASGKTTLASKYKDSGYLIFLEEYEKEEALINYYKASELKETKYYWYLFQTSLFNKWMEMINNIRNAMKSDHPPKVVIFDRTVLSSVVFYWYASSCGLICKNDLYYLSHMALSLFELVCEELGGTWLLLTIDDDHEKCYGRALKRNEETNLNVVTKTFTIIEDGERKRDPNIFTMDNFIFFRMSIDLWYGSLQLKYAGKNTIIFKDLKGIHHS